MAWSPLVEVNFFHRQRKRLFLALSGTDVVLGSVVGERGEVLPECCLDRTGVDDLWRRCSQPDEHFAGVADAVHENLLDGHWEVINQVEDPVDSGAMEFVASDLRESIVRGSPSVITNPVQYRWHVVVPSRAFIRHCSPGSSYSSP